MPGRYSSSIFLPRHIAAVRLQHGVSDVRLVQRTNDPSRQSPRRLTDDSVDLSLRQRGVAKQQALASGRTDPMGRKRRDSDTHGSCTTACRAIIHASEEVVVQITDDPIEGRKLV